MNKMRIILMILLLAQVAFGTIRYVSKTGSSTPPFTSWETASDSIQKCLDICIDGDTVIVANGVYKESLIINAAITFIGSSMDSCVIDGRGLERLTIEILNNNDICGFRIYGNKTIEYSLGIRQNDWDGNINISNCLISDVYGGIRLQKSGGYLKNLIITNVINGVVTFCASDTCKPKLTNSIIIVDNTPNSYAWNTSAGGQPTLLNNILLTKDEEPSNATGIWYTTANHKTLMIKNNLFGGFISSIDFYGGLDSAVIENNIFKDKKGNNFGVLCGANGMTRTRNNIFSNNNKVFYDAYNSPKIDYNIFWNNGRIFNNSVQYGLHNLLSNPMFVKDTLASSQKGDFHLQKYSPGIDAGDPGILDVDGSRSDIGMYGGPLGQSYQYLDLPPNPPRNIQYTANINEKKIIFTWKKNSESDFKEYHVFRDTVQGFTPDSAHLYLILPDSTLGDTAQFIDTYSGENAKYYYRIIATDNQGNESEPSDEISVIITGVDIIDVEIATDYRLYQNYPNPFNPNTVIGYQLAVGSYVKVMVYDIKGELLEVLVNENKPAGYYEVEFNAGKYASGIYLYRIEAVDESGIPRFMDMKKMIFIK